MDIEANEKDLYRLSVDAGLAIAIKNLALERAYIPYIDESGEGEMLLLKDSGKGILTLIQAYFPEEYEYTFSKLKRQLEAEIREALSEVNENGKESV